MKRRDFVKTAACIGCAGALCAGIPLSKKGKLSKIKNNIVERKYIYKSEKDLPKQIQLDICNLCQLNCATCWIRRDEKEIEEKAGGFGYVDFKTFKKFIDKHLFLEKIEISKHGEIFLNPDLDKIIEYAYENNIRLTAYNGVNLNTLSDETAKNLAKYRFGGMSVSIAGATAKTYSVFHKNGDFDTVIDNIKRINYYKNLYGNDYPSLIYKYIVFGHNEHEIEDAKKLAKSLNMKIDFVQNCIADYSPLRDKEKVSELTGLNFVDDSIKGYINLYKNNPEDWFFCTEIFKEPQINWNGELFGCGNQYLDGYKINVFKEGLLKALNSKAILDTKLAISDFSVEAGDNTPCKYCYVYRDLKELNVPVKYNEKVS